MGRISEAVKAEILLRIDIVALVRETVELRKAGASFTGRCPFHAEKTPSFNVHPGRRIFHCFGCGVGGDAIAFLMARDGLTFPEALRELGERVGVQVEEHAQSSAEQEQERRAREQREWLVRANELACAFWEETLWGPAGEAARRYLFDQRQVSEETVRAHRLGYAPAEWDALVQHLRRKQVPERLFPALGLLRPRQQGGGFYDWFRDRVLMPVIDLQGRIVAFSGRLLATDPEAAKYINSPETALFRKGESLFGLREARATMRTAGHAILVEGNFDLLTLHQAGFTQAVAPLGTALTPEQVRLLQRFTDQVYVCYDGDKAGRAAALKTVPLMVQAELDARVVELPDGEDPDSFVRTKGKEALLQLIERATPVVEVLIRHAAPRPGAPIEERLRAWERIGPVVAAVHHPIARQRYFSLAAEKLELDEKELQGYMSRPVSSKTPAASAGAARSGKPGAQVDQNARILLELLVDHPELAVRAAQSGVLELVPPQPLKEVLKVLFRLAEEEGPPSAAHVLETIDDPAARHAALEVLARPGVHCDDEQAGHVLEETLATLISRKRRPEPGQLVDLNKVDEGQLSSLFEERMRRARERHGL